MWIQELISHEGAIILKSLWRIWAGGLRDAKWLVRAQVMGPSDLEQQTLHDNQRGPNDRNNAVARVGATLSL